MLINSTRDTFSDALTANRRLYFIDALKVISFVLVFAFHCNIHLGVHFKFDGLTRFVSQGAVLMDLFFLLSGFAQYYSNANHSMTAERAKKFYLKRLVSVYPLYLFAQILFLLFFDKGSIVQKLLTLPVELSLLQSWFSGLFSYSHNGGTWFISCLAFCYFLFPVLKDLLERMSRKQLMAYLLAVYVLCATAPFIVIVNDLPNTYSNPLLRMLQFLAGMLVAALFQRGFRISPIMGAAISVASALAVFLLVDRFVDIGYYPHTYVTYSFATLPLFILLVMGLTAAEIGTPPRERLGSLLQTLGKFAYPVFLAQLFVWPPANKIISAYPRFFQTHGNSKTFLLVALICTVITLLLHYVVELPCQKFLKKKLNLTK